MATTKKKLTEETEIKRLKKLFKDAPEPKLKTLEGLIVEAARLRVRLNNLWLDLSESGEYEKFKQGENEYERERPASKTYTATNKSYLSVIKVLSDLLPEERKDDIDELAEFR